MERGKSVLDLVGDTPLVELTRLAAGLPSRVFAKCEHLNPGGSVKDRIAIAIIDDAEKRGVLAPGATLVEATAGNTGLGLAMVAAIRGYKLVCVLPEKMSEDKRTALRITGAEVIVTPNAPPGDPRHFQAVAARLAEERGWFLTDQFRNEANVEVHERTTGPELLAQTGGEITAFVAGVGTGGTLTGCGRVLRERLGKEVRIVAVEPEKSAVLSGKPPGPHGIQGLGAGFVPTILDRSLIDEVVTVSDVAAERMARRIAREEGLLVGPSAGANVQAAIEVARRVKGTVVTILCDSGERYLV